MANGERRMCVNCGKTAPADRLKPGDELTECIGPYGMSACTFDTTPQEAWEFWSKRWHELHQSLPTIRASARREALEEAARWHEAQIKRGEEAIWADPHVNYAAAIRSLAAPEADNG